MPKVISEKYENGVLVERKTEGANTTPWHWLMLAVHLIVAISLAVIALLAVRDSLLIGNASDEESMPTVCEPPRVRS
jgi:hypothetical protein